MPDLGQRFLAEGTPDSGSIADSPRELNCLNRRFVLSVTALNKFAEARILSRKRIILIWIGAGWPLLYNKHFRHDDSQTTAHFFEHLVRPFNRLRMPQLTFDMLLPPFLFRKAEDLNDHDAKLLDGIARQKDVTAGSLGLQALVHQSGGQILIGEQDYVSDITGCIDDAKSYYQLVNFASRNR